MKFYRGYVNIGKEPVISQIPRGLKPMTYNDDKKLVYIANSQPIDPMSAAEVVVLRHMHGSDSISELYEVGAKKQLSFAAERDRLEQVYGEKIIAKVYGPRGAGGRLPREVEDIGPEPVGEPVEVKMSVDTDALDAPETEDKEDRDAA